MPELPPRAEPFFSIVMAGMRRPSIWAQPTWSDALPALDVLVGLSGVPVAVRSIQSERGDARRQLRLGRLTWAAKSHDRWVHGAPDATVNGTARDFFFTEIWAPSWNSCDKEAGAPFLFISIENPHLLGEARDDQFNQLVHVALPRALALAHRDTVSEAIRQLASAVASALTVCRVTPWWQGSDSTQSALTNHFNYASRDDDAVPDLWKLRTAWQSFDGILPEDPAQPPAAP
ncbi:MAG TPA: hypothetical protein VF159_05330 [Gemmatimonadaceae bacterium]